MKLKKLVALITAGALCLGMSMTAFAADDKSPEEVPTTWGEADGGKLQVWNGATPEERQEIADKAMAWMEKNTPNIAKDAEIIFVGDYDLFQKNDKGEWDWLEDGKVPGGKKLFSFDVNDIENKEGFVPGKTVYALHGNADGTFTPIEGKLVYDEARGWFIEVEMSEFSPVVFLKVMSNGKIVEVDWKGDVVDPKTKTATRTASPKTGE